MKPDNVFVLDQDDDRPSTFKKMAYGGSGQVVASERSYRLERGHPFLRGGKMVVALPQFKALTIYSPVSTNAGQLPSSTTTPTAITYPSKTV